MELFQFFLSLLPNMLMLEAHALAAQACCLGWNLLGDKLLLFEHISHSLAGLMIFISPVCSNASQCGTCLAWSEGQHCLSSTCCLWLLQQAALVAEAIDAWLQTAAAQRGLFSRRNEPVNANDTSVGDPEAGDAEDHMEFMEYCADGMSHPDRGGESSRAARVVEHVRAQAVWLGFLEEMWQVSMTCIFLFLTTKQQGIARLKLIALPEQQA